VFTFPDLDATEDFAPVLKDALARQKELASIAADKISDDELAELEAVNEGIGQINAKQGERDAAAAERIQRIEAAQAAAAAAKEEPAEPETPAEPVEPAAPETPTEEPIVVPDDASTLIEENETVTASAAAKKSVAQTVAPHAPEVEAPPATSRPTATIIASGEGTGFAMGSELKGMEQVVDAFISRTKGMPKRKGAPGTFAKHGVASFSKNTPSDLMLVRGEQEQNFAKIQQAALDQADGGALVAAGGWCAPSETIYDIPTLETVSGIASFPEVGITHGGISFTKGPDFAQIYADSGFLQTEAQAEAGEPKNFIDVECPGFTEVRLDAIGYGVRAGILTNSAWPELVRRYIEGVLVAHAHKVNGAKISRVYNMALAASPGGAAITAGALGAALPDALDALEMQAVRLRYKFRLGESARIEGVAPIWFMSVLRRDLSYQLGLETKAITDAQVTSWLTARNIYLQWVYDFQDLPATGTTWPTSVDVVLYPTGSYVVGTSDVISLDVVHDTASLTENTFTAAFFEEALMVFNPKANGVVSRIPLTAYGRSGAMDITNLVAA
jgi:hypothetical protein